MGCTWPVVVVVIWTFHPRDTSIALSMVEPFGGHLLPAATRVGWYDVSNSASRQNLMSSMYVHAILAKLVAIIEPMRHACISSCDTWPGLREAQGL